MEVVIPVFKSGPGGSSSKKTKPASAKTKEDKEKAAKPLVKKVTAPPKDTSGEVDAHDAEHFPNGWFYCHQCEKKRGNEVRLQCTLRDPKPHNERCKAKYCKPCLRNRYDQDFDELKSHTGEGLTKSEKARHVSGESYYFECFKCRDMCNCKRCRRRHGLDPTGRFEPKKDGKATSGDNSDAKPKKPRKPKAAKIDEATQKPIKSSSASKPPPQPATKPRPRAKPAPKLKPIPRPTWTKLHVPFSLSELESRILIREFVHRFDGILQVSMSNVEELEELTGETLGGDEWEDGGEELVGWVSEGCVKAVIIGLLEVIAGRLSTSGQAQLAKEVKETVKAIRASGANLNRIWGAMAELRDSFSEYQGGVFLEYPDPLAPPATTTYRSTRSGTNGMNTHSGVYVACSAQMVPVVAYLVNQAIDSPAIREAIDLGVTDVKDISQGSKEAITKENTRYKEEKDVKKDRNDLKAAKEAHQQTLQDLELGQRLALSSYAPRFSPLGRDMEGRMYYALTPSASECEAAEKLVTGKGSGKVKLRGKRGGLSEEDRREMNRWSWFICVHGGKPAGALKAKRRGDENDGDESELTDEEEDVWWGFWEPAEVKKLAEWLALKHGLDTEDGKTKKKDDEPVTGPSTTGQAHPSNLNGKVKKASLNGAGRGRPSTTSSARSSIKGKSRDISPLSDLSSSSGDADTSSELSDIDSDSDVEMDTEEEFANLSRPTPGRHELRVLVKGLTDYAVMLQWRIGRVAPNDPAGNAGKDKDKDKEAEKEKEKAKATVPAARFYG